MHLPESWLAYLFYVLDAITSSWSDTPGQQKLWHAHPVLHRPSNGPIFPPPYPPSDPPPPDVAIQCDYSAMGKSWKSCNAADDRGCWLSGPGDQKFGIETNYELSWPKGITRKYTLDVSEMALAPDGVCMPHAKVFNGSYPGPWIQACWGDDLEITVRNHLWYNGTTIHWHGIRQWNSMEMDGVNAVTQCPIAPRDEFTYKFKAMQYGSSWYHSHYSLQYADGLVGPMTIYGPSSENYTEAIEPILMTDWNHRSAFEDWSWSLQPKQSRPEMTNILLNGKGRYNNSDPDHPIGLPERYSKVLERGKRYLIRLINTSLDTTFVFAIDGHNLTVIGSDFVPIEPYNTSSVLVGIGQRYHVVLQADPIKQSPGDNYWIRTIPAHDCSGFVTHPDVQTGIIRYDLNETADPTSTQADFPTECSDEPYESLIPKLKWQVGPPANEEATNGAYEVGLMNVNGTPYHPNWTKGRWTADEKPLWLNFGEPTIFNLDPENGSWPNHLDVVTQDHAEDSWVYFVIISDAAVPKHKTDFFLPVAHPIHLHGHDFALLAQSSKPYPGRLDKVTLKTKNPPRRDVVLLPMGGYIVIAFKTDNPGVWLLHCHIAWHASSGLAFQVLENKHQIKINPDTLSDMHRTCAKWDDWWGDVRNHWNRTTKDEFQDDSGI
ncbi:MAG: hypothetical protein M1837_004987 [Sclerophora amabilis]|nr:MAG: hypothetical protein M1837_004987 [Sclerophora amabilis]